MVLLNERNTVLVEFSKEMMPAFLETLNKANIIVERDGYRFRLSFGIYYYPDGSRAVFEETITLVEEQP